MLVARRDPFHPGAHDVSYEQGAGAAIGRAPRLARTVSMLQVVGSLLAIPVGLASGYSIYRANFSPDTTCQGLRGSIVSMIDKSVDAATRRMLVRRDVEKFEQDCGAIDPEATAAFKSLLASDKPAAPVAAPVVRRVDTPPQEQVRKVEARPQAIAKQAPIAAAPAAVSERARRDPAVSDAQWLDAVRHALVPHDAEPAVAKTPDAVLHAQWPGQQEAALPPRAAPASTAAALSLLQLPLPSRRLYRPRQRSRRRPCRSLTPVTRCRRPRSPIRSMWLSPNRKSTHRACGGGLRKSR